MFSRTNFWLVGLLAISLAIIGRPAFALSSYGAAAYRYQRARYQRARYQRARYQRARYQRARYQRARYQRARYQRARRAEAGIASEGWWSQTGSNRRPHACKARALPAELWPRTRTRRLAGLPSRSSADSPPSPVGLWRDSLGSLRERRLVGLGRLELPTSRLSSARSNQLSYKPLTTKPLTTKALQRPKSFNDQAPLTTKVL